MATQRGNDSSAQVARDSDVSPRDRKVWRFQGLLIGLIVGCLVGWTVVMGFTALEAKDAAQSAALTATQTKTLVVDFTAAEMRDHSVTLQRDTQFTTLLREVKQDLQDHSSILLVLKGDSAQIANDATVIQKDLNAICSVTKAECVVTR